MLNITNFILMTIYTWLGLSNLKPFCSVTAHLDRSFVPTFVLYGCVLFCRLKSFLSFSDL